MAVPQLLNGTIQEMKEQVVQMSLKQQKRQDGQRENETGETKRKSLGQDLKRRHQCVWAVLNNLLLPDQTLFN